MAALPGARVAAVASLITIEPLGWRTQVELIRRDYTANGGWETFLSYEDPIQGQQDGRRAAHRAGGASLHSFQSHRTSNEENTSRSRDSRPVMCFPLLFIRSPLHAQQCGVCGWEHSSGLSLSPPFTTRF